MIKTVEEALAVFNEKRFAGRDDWREFETLYLENAGKHIISGAQIYDTFTAISIARSLNGDYEALEAENASLSSKLERVREAAAGAVREFSWLMTNHSQWANIYGPTLNALRSALAETEEENVSGDNGESVQS